MSYDIINGIIDGKKFAADIKQETLIEVENLNKKNIFPTLAVVLVGDNNASKVYFNSRKKTCEQTNIKTESFELSKNSEEKVVIDLIHKLNKYDNIHGILLQMPMPNHIDSNKILLAIDRDKDVDGFNPYNVGLLQANLADLKPCTASGIMELLKRSDIEIEGKHCVIVGRSNVVGRPLASMLLAENGTVTVAHSKTKNLNEITKSADILISATGKANLITADMVKEGVVVIDVGMNRVDGKLCGDVDFLNVKEKASFITPVPGGVGPMTTAMLMRNCVIACKKQNHLL